MIIKSGARLIAGLLFLAISIPGFTPKYSAATAQQQGYSLAFVDADVRRVVDAVLGAMLGMNYSIDSDVTGTVTLRTTSAVPEDELLPLLEKALASVDAVVLKRGDSIRIVSRKNARTLAPLDMQAAQQVPAQTGTEGQRFEPSAPGFANEVIPLRFANAERLAELATEFLGDGIISATQDGTSSVIVSGSAQQRDAAKRLIARFDIDSLANAVFEIYRLENVDADTLVAELETIFQPPYDILGGRLRLVPLQRLRSVLGIAADRADLARIEPWITRLDNGVSGKRKLYSYAVQNGRAADIAAALQLVLGNAAAIPAPLPPPPQNVAPIGSIGEESIGRAPAAPPPLPPVIPPPIQPDIGQAVGPRIVPNAQNNSLLIYADGEEYQFIREALDKLDQPVAQVLIEATLAEVTLSDDLAYGVDFSFIDGTSTQTSIRQSNNEGGTVGPAFPGFSVSVVGSTASAVLNALESETDVRVLSAPKLVTLNNEPATLQVGDQVPIVTQQSQGVQNPDAPIVSNIELRDTGVILQVTPRVNDSGTIILDISQEVSDVARTTTSGIDSPTIQQRRLTSTVATRSGQMIALGGLIRNSTTKTRSGIPFFSRIPIIGSLFGRQQTIGARTELIILLTPTVIRSAEDTDTVVDALIDGLDLTRPLVDQARQEQVGGNVLTDGQQPEEDIFVDPLPIP